jgi:hypothetical protein
MDDILAFGGDAETTANDFVWQPNTAGVDSQGCQYPGKGSISNGKGGVHASCASRRSSTVMASAPTPLVARFIRNFTSIYGNSAGDPQKSGSACSTGFEAGLRPDGSNSCLELLADIV